VNPSNQALLNWILCFGFLASIASNIAIVYGQFRRKPPIDAAFVAKKDFERLEGTVAELKDQRFQDVTALGLQISEAIAQSIKDGAESRKLMHMRMDTLERGQATMEERTRTQGNDIRDIKQQVTELVAATGKISGIVERIEAR
jgi:hypothetical protein